MPVKRTSRASISQHALAVDSLREGYAEQAQQPEAAAGEAQVKLRSKIRTQTGGFRHDLPILSFGRDHTSDRRTEGLSVSDNRVVREGQYKSPQVPLPS